MPESGYSPGRDLLKKAAVVVGLLAGGESISSNTQEKPVLATSAEKSHAEPVVYGDHDRHMSLGPDLQPSIDGLQELGVNENAGRVDSQKSEKVSRVQDMIQLLGEKYREKFTFECNSDAVCRVYREGGLSGSVNEDLHIFDFRFDESGACYVKKIITYDEFSAGSKSRVRDGKKAMETKIVNGPNQKNEFLSVVREFIGDSDRFDDEVRNQIIAKIEGYFSQSKTIEDIIKKLDRNGVAEKSVLEDLLYDIYLKYYEGSIEDKYHYREKLQDYFNKKDKDEV